MADRCAACGEDLHRHRADDFPAYCLIFPLGHILIPAVARVELAYAPPYWLQMAFRLPFTMIVAAALLQPMKGAVIALHWSVGRHGFEAAKAARAAQK